MDGTRMLQRRGSAAEWAASNPILGDGELGWERDTNVVKIGDGVTAWNDLETFFILRTLVDAKGDLLVGVADNAVARLAASTPGYHLEVQPDSSLAWVAMPDYILSADANAKYADKTSTDPQEFVGAVQADGGIYDGMDRVYSPSNPSPSADLTSRVAKAGDTMTGALIFDNQVGVRFRGQAGDNAEDAIFSKVAGDTNLLLRKADGVTKRGLDAGPLYDSGNRVYSASNPPPAGGAVINQTIRGVLTISAGSDNASATISSVNMAKSQLRLLGWRIPWTANLIDQMVPLIKLASSTSIAAERNDSTATGVASSTLDTIISYELTEWT